MIIPLLRIIINSFNFGSFIVTILNILLDDGDDYDDVNDDVNDGANVNEMVMMMRLYYFNII